MMRYQIILEFDEDWAIDEVMRMLQEKSIDCFYHVQDTEEMENSSTCLKIVHSLLQKEIKA